MNFLIPFGVELLIEGLIYVKNNKSELKEKFLGIFDRCCRYPSNDSFIIDSEEDMIKYTRYEDAMNEWEYVNTINQAIKWHDKYTPQLKIDDYLDHYYPINIDKSK
jgi:hypothetical protein